MSLKYEVNYDDCYITFEGINQYDDDYVYWWDDMRPKEVRDLLIKLAEAAYKKGFQDAKLQMWNIKE